MSLTKSQLIDTIAKRGDMPRKTAARVVNTIFDSMSEALVEGNRIEMRGFGTFSVKHYPGYVGRNPRTGQEVQVAPKRAIQFRVGKELRERVNDGFDPGEAFSE